MSVLKLEASPLDEALDRIERTLDRLDAERALAAEAGFDRAAALGRIEKALDRLDAEGPSTAILDMQEVRLAQLEGLQVRGSCFEGQGGVSQTLGYDYVPVSRVGMVTRTFAMRARGGPLLGSSPWGFDWY